MLSNFLLCQMCSCFCNFPLTFKCVFTEVVEVSSGNRVRCFVSQKVFRASDFSWSIPCIVEHWYKLLEIRIHTWGLISLTFHTHKLQSYQNKLPRPFKFIIPCSLLKASSFTGKWKHCQLCQPRVLNKDPTVWLNGARPTPKSASKKS